MLEAEALHQLFTTGQKSQTGQVVCLRLELATQPSREVKSLEHHVWENLTFHIPSYTTIYIPVGSQIVAHTQMETGDGPNKPNTINL